MAIARHLGSAHSQTKGITASSVRQLRSRACWATLSFASRLRARTAATSTGESPTVAYVRARYICEGGAGAHVWMSVKQAESRRPEPWLREEGSGAHTAAWSHTHRDAVVCDGRWHVATFTVDQAEWGWGELKPGQAWVQFCVIPPGGEESGEIAWSMRYAAVK